METYGEVYKLLNLYANVSHRFILGYHYQKALTGHRGTFWPFIQNSVIEATVLHWCHLFLDRDGDLYYKKFFARAEVVAVGAQYQPDAVKARFLTKLGISEADFLVFWRSIKSLRDQWIAHKDLDVRAAFPALESCKVLTDEFRRVLCEWCGDAYKSDVSAGDLWAWSNFFKRDDADRLARECERAWENKEGDIVAR